MAIDRFILPMAAAVLPGIAAILYIFYREHGRKPLKPHLLWIVGMSAVSIGILLAALLVTSGTSCCS